MRAIDTIGKFSLYGASFGFFFGSTTLCNKLNQREPINVDILVSTMVSIGVGVTAGFFLGTIKALCEELCASGERQPHMRV